MKKLLGLSLSMALLALSASPAFANPEDTSSQVNVSGIVTMATQGAYSADALNTVHFNLTAANGVDATVSAGTGADTAHGSNGGAEFAGATDGLTITSTKGNLTNYTVDAEFAVDTLVDAANGTDLDIQNGVPADSGDVSVQILDDTMSPDRSGATPTGAGVDSSVGDAACDFATALAANDTFTAIADIPGATLTSPEVFYAYNSATSADDNTCVSMTTDLFPSMELTTHGDGVALGQYEGTLVFALTEI